MNNKFSFRLQKILTPEQSIFQSIKKDIIEIENEFKKISSEDAPKDFIAEWEHYIKLMNSNIDRYEIDQLIENTKQLKKSYIINEVIPQEKLEKIFNHKNLLLNNLLNKLSLVLNTFCQLPNPEQRANYLNNVFEQKNETI